MIINRIMRKILFSMYNNNKEKLKKKENSENVHKKFLFNV